MTTTNYKVYANFNSFVADCRILNSEIVTRKNGDRFLAITAVTNGLNDDEGMNVTFNNSNGLMSLFEKGMLPKGRRITVTGHISTVRETYKDQATGEIRMLKRPEIKLVDAAIPTGGLGPMPKELTEAKIDRTTVVVRPSDAGKQEAAEPFVDKTPSLEPQAF